LGKALKLGSLETREKLCFGVNKQEKQMEVGEQKTEIKTEKKL